MIQEPTRSTYDRFYKLTAALRSAMMIYYKVFKWTKSYYKSWLSVIKYFYETILTSVTFHFQSRNLNAFRGTETGLIKGGYRPSSHVKDEDTKSSLLLLTHMLTWVKRRTLFRLSFLSLFHTLTLVRRRASFACFSLTLSHFYISKTKSLICLREGRRRVWPIHVSSADWLRHFRCIFRFSTCM